MAAMENQTLIGTELVLVTKQPQPIWDRLHRMPPLSKCGPDGRYQHLTRPRTLTATGRESRRTSPSREVELERDRQIEQLRDALDRERGERQKDRTQWEDVCYRMREAIDVLEGEKEAQSETLRDLEEQLRKRQAVIDQQEAEKEERETKTLAAQVPMQEDLEYYRGIIELKDTMITQLVKEKEMLTQERDRLKQLVSEKTAVVIQQTADLAKGEHTFKSLCRKVAVLEDTAMNKEKVFSDTAAHWKAVKLEFEGRLKMQETKVIEAVRAREQEAEEKDRVIAARNLMVSRVASLEQKLTESASIIAEHQSTIAKEIDAKTAISQHLVVLKERMQANIDFIAHQTALLTATEKMLKDVTKEKDIERGRMMDLIQALETQKSLLSAHLDEAILGKNNARKSLHEHFMKRKTEETMHQAALNGKEEKICELELALEREKTSLQQLVLTQQRDAEDNVSALADRDAVNKTVTEEFERLKKEVVVMTKDLEMNYTWTRKQSSTQESEATNPKSRWINAFTIGSFAYLPSESHLLALPKRISLKVVE